jgi:pyrophosphatase PpaX
MDIENLKLIAFDVDGTLADTDDYYTEKASALEHKLLPFVSVERLEKINRPVIMAGETVLHGFYRLLDLVGLDKLISKLHSHFSINKDYKYKEIAEMRKTLKALSKKYMLGIITSGGRGSTDAFIRKFKLEKMISFVVSSEDCKFIKPHPAPMQKMAEEAGVLPENCVLVGDTMFDILCAHRAGAYAVAIKSGFDSEWLLRKHKADLVLETVNDLPRILLKN